MTVNSPSEQYRKRALYQSREFTLRLFFWAGVRAVLDSNLPWTPARGRGEIRGDVREMAGNDTEISGPSSGRVWVGLGRSGSGAWDARVWLGTLGWDPDFAG